MVNMQKRLFRFNKSPDQFETLLGASAAFDGHLECSGGVRVEGEVKGGIETDGNIIVGKGANVTADLRGHNMLIARTADGNAAWRATIERPVTGEFRGRIECKAGAW